MNAEDLEKRVERVEETLEEVKSIAVAMLASQRSVAMIAGRGLAKCPQVGAALVGLLFSDAVHQAANAEGPSSLTIEILRDLLRDLRVAIAADAR